MDQGGPREADAHAGAVGDEFAVGGLEAGGAGGGDADAVRGGGEGEEEGVVGGVVEVEEEGWWDGTGRKNVSGGNEWLEQKDEGEKGLVHCVWW